jgi:hypothetical protein
VTVHQIKLTLPTIEIGRKNLVFKVSFDGKEQGVLHISKGGLDWLPKTPQSKKCARTWNQFRGFMEGEAEPSVADEQGQAASPEDVVIDSLATLLRETGYKDLGEVEDMLQDDCDVDIGLEDDGSDGIIVSGPGAGYCMNYPFTLGHLYSLVDDIDLEYVAETGYQELASKIEQTEGFEVEVSLDQNQWWLSEDGQQLDNGSVVLFPVARYPYRRAMSGRKTIADWRTIRFERNYPGLEVVVSTSLPDTALLSELKGE